MKRFAIIFLLLGLASLANSQPTTTFTPEQQAYVDEHVYLGLPSGNPVLVRQGYITEYDAENRIPKWVAYHITVDYLETPPREGRFKTFRNDPDIDPPVTDDDYKHDSLFYKRGFARGHLAPYGVMGGDRDGDGLYAEDDDFDELTIYQANYMSNIAPQHHNEFNGAGGLWYKLEYWVQNTLVQDSGWDVWIFAGCILGPGEHEAVGPDADITVPAMFYKIEIRENPADPNVPIVLAFLFPHQRSRHGEFQDYLVSVDVIEALTDLDFFSDMAENDEAVLEDTDTWEFWETF